MLGPTSSPPAAIDLVAAPLPAGRPAPRSWAIAPSRVLVAAALLCLLLGTLNGAVGSTYGLSGSPPRVTKVKPDAGRTVGGMQATISGINLTGATAVEFGSTEATSYRVRSSTRIAAIAPAGTGTVDVTVTTPAGTSATGPADRFTYLPAASVTEVSPKTGPAGGGTSVTITGVDLGEATGVEFGSTAASSFTVSSPTSITAISPPGPAGRVDVRVITPEGASATSTKDRFAFTPTITRLSPNGGSLTQPTTVTVTGAGFAPGTTGTIFKFGATKATAGNCSSTITCTVVAPAAAAAGEVNVRAIVNKKISPIARADLFTYHGLYFRTREHGRITGRAEAEVDYRIFGLKGAINCEERAEGDIVASGGPTGEILVGEVFEEKCPRELFGAWPGGAFTLSIGTDGTAVIEGQRPGRTLGVMARGCAYEAPDGSMSGSTELGGLFFARLSAVFTLNEARSELGQECSETATIEVFVEAVVNEHPWEELEVEVI
ncbi:MAG TPA: IPT/TIG domain-containing protein [Solirubrobacteraceae bacterium]|nr:IPT/TIG domain-containing protein [Solirubrobacteraceae bacterium]